MAMAILVEAVVKLEVYIAARKAATGGVQP